MTSRRLFLTGSAVALASPLLAQAPRTPSLSRRPDPLLREIERQFRQVHKGFQNGEPTVGRHAAAAFHLMAAWVEAKNLDADVRKVIRRENRQKLVHDIAFFDRRADAVARGFTPPPTMVSIFNPAHVDRALRRVEEIGAAQVFRQMATHIERNEERLVAGMTRTGTIRSAIHDPNNPPPPEEDPNCSGADFATLMNSVSAFVLCLLLWELCVVVGISGLTWEAYKWYIGC